MIDERKDLAERERRQEVTRPAGPFQIEELGQVQAEHSPVEETRAQRAWSCVEAETRRSTARWLRNAVISATPSVRGWRSRECEEGACPVNIRGRDTARITIEREASRQSRGRASGPRPAA